jgi:hypothetical protein
MLTVVHHRPADLERCCLSSQQTRSLEEMRLVAVPLE